MYRRLRVLLVFALVPITLLAAPSVAEAATVYGTPHTAQIHLDTWQPQEDSDCALTAYYAVAPGSEVVKWKLDCDSQFFGRSSDAETTVTFKGTVVDDSTGGTTCNAVDVKTTDGDGKASGARSFPSVEFGGSMCQVGTVCLSQHKVIAHYPDSDYDEVCTNLPLGPPPGAAAAPSTCAYGTVTRPALGDMYESNQDGIGRGYPTRNLSASITGTSADKGWIVYAVLKWPDDEDLSLWPITQLTQDQRAQQLAPSYVGSMFGGTTAGATSVITGPVFTGPRKAHTSEDPLLNRAIVVGVGVVAVEGDSTQEQQGDTISGLWQWVPRDASVEQSGGARARDKLGLTDPSKCAFYWGEKIADVSDSTVDNPIGPLSDDGGGGTGDTTEPTPDDPTPTPPAAGDCTFSFSDPLTWAGGGICVLVKMIGKAVDVLGGIFQAVTGIPSAILSGLQALFVPSDGFIGSKIDAVKASWSDSPPGVIVGQLGDLPGLITPPAASSCQGVELPLHMGLDGHESDVHPFDACGPRAGIASIARLAATVVVYLGAFLVAVRVIAAAFGVDASLGRGGDSA
jgi:hypothetical protein